MELFPLLFLLFPGFGVTSAQELSPEVVNVPEGEDALLPCTLNSGKSIVKFDWRKEDGLNVFLYESGSYYGNGRRGQSDQFKSRVDFFEEKLEEGNASITITNTRLEDNGNYSCGLVERYRPVHVTLNVGASPVPYIKTIRDKTKWRLLECKAKGIPEPELEWRNGDGEVLAKHDPQTKDKYVPVELQVKVTKSNSYTCVATQKGIHHQINSTLEVSIPDVVAVSEGADAVLPCSLDSKITENLLFSWRKEDEEVLLYNRGQVKKVEQFIGRLGLFQQELKYGNASIKIHNVQKSDDGYYTCHLQDIQKSHVILQVVEISHVWKVTTISIGIALFVAVAIIVGLIVKLKKKKEEII